MFREGQPATALYVLLSGAVILRKRDFRGHESAIRLCGPGTALEYRSILCGTAHSMTAICATTSSLVRLAPERLRANGRLTALFIREMSVELQTVQEQMLTVSTAPVHERVLRLLNRLTPEFGTLDKNGHLVIDMPISRRDMAAMIGMTPESLSRCIGKLEQTGIARFARHTVIVFDPESLAETDLDGETPWTTPAYIPAHDQSHAGHVLAY